MRFSKELKVSKVQAWRSKYVRYAEIKVKIKELKRLYEEHHVAVTPTAPTTSPNHIPPLIEPNTALELVNDKSLKEYASYMQFDGRCRDESLHSEIEFVDTVEGTERKERDHPVDRASSPFTYRFSTVASVIQSEGRLASKVPQQCAQDIRLKEKEIALMLEQDIYTVSKFYAQQCRYVEFESVHYMDSVQYPYEFEFESALTLFRLC